MPDLIPYITLRDGEQDTSDAALTVQLLGGAPALGIPPRHKLTYLDEAAEDRDPHGILLSRHTQNPLDAGGQPTGKPFWKAVNAARQRECMAALLCHVCKGEASTTDSGLLFLDIADDEARAKPRWPQGWSTTQPPLCLPHAKAAADQCPHGKRNNGFTALRVGRPRLVGILGTLYRPSPIHPAGITPVKTNGAEEMVSLPFNHPHIPMLLGVQYQVALHDVTEVDLNEELAAAGLA